MRLRSISGEELIDVEPELPPSDPEAMRRGSAVVVASRYMAMLDGLDARGAIFPRAAPLNGLSLRAASFSHAQLYEASFVGADLSDVDFSGADLRGARFDTACIARANLMGANLMGADMAMASREQVALSRWAGALTVGMKLAGQVLTRNPLSITGLTYEVTALGNYVIIGCQMQTIEAWQTWGLREGISADGKAGGRFASEVLPRVLAIVEAWRRG